MPETTPLIKAALNLRVGVGFDVYCQAGLPRQPDRCPTLLIIRTIVLQKIFPVGNGSDPNPDGAPSISS